MQYRADAKRDLRQIAAALGVANVLEGTVRRDGNHVRVSSELVDASNDNTIWADSYDRDLTDIFTIQSEVAQIIATKLTATVSPEEKKRIEAKPTDNLEAYDLYLQAKQLVEANYSVLPSNEKQVYSKIISLLEQATHKDGKFALAYCSLAKAHDMLYVDRIDRTPERRALGDAAVDTALRLRPDLSEAHLAYANHLFLCYHDFERTRVQIAIAAQALPNNPDVLELTALLDRVQGRWEQAVAALEGAVALDPRNPDCLSNLAETYSGLRRYRDAERTIDRLIELQPDDRMLPVWKATIAFGETADVKRAVAAFEALPVSVKNDPEVALHRFIFAICTRDFATAEEILSKNPNQEILFIGAPVPRQFWVLWLDRAKGNHPTIEQFGAPREQLYQKVEADPTDPVLLTALALTDVPLGRKEEAMQEGRRAMELRPISEDAVDGTGIAYYVAMVYALANQPDLAFEKLNSLVKIPGWFLNYGDLKTNPGWDPLRKDPRFDKLLAELTPREPAEKSIAVLPFDNISPNKDDAYFADGVQDEILNNLAKIGQLKVICRTSVMQYRADAKRDLHQIADALGVANVLEGTVRRDGNHVRVSTELVDARDGTTIWADSYDRDLTDIFAIQSEIAQTVASRLTARLSPEEEKSIAEKPTDNLVAYDLYLQAKQLLQANYWVLQKDETEIYQRIISLLENATAKDRNFALAYCVSAKAHDILYVDRIDHTPGRRALGDAAVNEALRLRPDLPEAHLAMASHLYYCYRNFDRARVQIAMAAQGLSNNPEVLELTALIDRVQGRWEQSTTGLERATALDPRNPEVLGHLADNYGRLRRYRDCEEIFNRLIALEPDNPTFLLGKINWIFSENADVKGARAACEAFPSSTKADPWVANQRFYYATCARDFAAAEQILNEIPNQEIAFLNARVPRQIVMLQLEFVQGNLHAMKEFAVARAQLCQEIEADPSNPWLMMVLALTDVALGRKDEGIQEGQRALEMRPISEDAFDGPAVARNVAIVYATADRLDAAFEQLNRLIRMPADPLSYGDLKACPCWDPLRKDPRFDKLLAELAPRD
jgi:TolB-like protein/predicted Zn-dependent protease